MCVRARTIPLSYDFSRKKKNEEEIYENRIYKKKRNITIINRTAAVRRNIYRWPKSDGIKIKEEIVEEEGL